MTAKFPLAQSVIDTLASAGVREIYGIAGGAETPLLACLVDQDAIEFVGVRHEFAAAVMAAATWDGHGRLAVCLGEQGPGTLNLASGLGVARNNNLPLLAITVSADSVLGRPGSGALMELDTVALLRPIVKWQYEVKPGDDVAALVRTALRVAREGRPGPVQIDIPRDVLALAVHEVTNVVSEPADTPAEAVDAATIDQAVSLLRSAQRPLVIAGGGAAEASELLRQVATHLGAVTVTTQMGLGILPSDGPLFAGQGGVIGGPALIRAATEADVVLTVGMRTSSWWWRNGESLIGGARVVSINTDNARTSTATELAIHGDAQETLEQLWSVLGSTEPLPATDWAREVRADYLAHRDRLNELAQDVAAPAHPAALASRLGELIDPSIPVVLDGGHTTFWSNDFTRALHPRTVFHEPGMGHLGFGVPYANALALAREDRRSIVITGDGAFGFSLVELDTARRLGLRTITVIHDNEVWGVITVAQGRAGFSLGTDLSGTDYAAIAEGFGCRGIRVTELDQLDEAWKQALAEDLPVVLDVRVKFLPHPMMPDFGRTTAQLH